MILIFAPKYDPVTTRMIEVARRLSDDARSSNVRVVVLFEAIATRQDLAQALLDRFTVAAFYCHGDFNGQLLTQDREPCWSMDRPPTFYGAAIFAHACRAMIWLSGILSRIGARVVVGYRVDLATPLDASVEFWTYYAEIHTFVPTALHHGIAVEKIRREFYELCTDRFHRINSVGGSLIELIAIQQSRDRLEVAEGMT